MAGPRPQPLTVTLDRAPVRSASHRHSLQIADAVGATTTATAGSGVLAHASDADGDGLTVTAVSDATRGAGTVGTSLAGSYGHLTLECQRFVFLCRR